MDNKCAIIKLPHHLQQKLCHTRPLYRQGKKLTSVKVYTINDESKHLMICGVPKLQLGEEVRKLVEPYGTIEKIYIVPDYPTEEFTETYYVQYIHVQSARIAKRYVDGKNFYGGSLHVFYVPELESISDTKEKLLQRQKEVAMRIKKNQKDMLNPNVDKFLPKEQYNRRKKTPALPLTEERLHQQYPGKTLVSIYDGIPQSLDPRAVCEPNSVENKRKNYKGQSVNTNVKVRIVRPQIIDTNTIVKRDTSNKNVFSSQKKVQSNITIKLIPRNDNGKKRIVIKNPSVSQLVQPSKNLQSSIDKAKSQIRTAMQMNSKENP
ncbi:unnamed protein product [Heterotrigona itama]|uniref:RNA-binding protein 48 n=1 Tax=Heterotrigona itama TaxID=395501 RepID=A0A6V7H6E6_9HYME|nr:unnamed protein product [Heterotrigona itama]